MECNIFINQNNLMPITKLGTDTPTNPPPNKSMVSHKKNETKITLAPCTVLWAAFSVARRRSPPRLVGTLLCAPLAISAPRCAGAVLRPSSALSYVLRGCSPLRFTGSLLRLLLAFSSALRRRSPLPFAGALLRPSPPPFSSALRRRSPPRFAGAFFRAAPAGE